MKKTDSSYIYFLLKFFQVKSKIYFIKAVCFLFAFSSFNSYSASAPGDCGRHFVKPKRVKLLPPEKISSLSREETYSLQPKHLFRAQPADSFQATQEDGKLGDFRLTVEQFQALNLNDLRPATLEAIASRRDVVIMIRPEQVQALDLNELSSHTVLALMNTPLNLTQKFQELDLSHWPQQDLESVRDTFSIARHLSQEQTDFIKQRKFLSQQESGEQEEALALQRKKEDVEAVRDHGLFEQAIAEEKFDREIIPFLRVSELNDNTIPMLVNALYDITQDKTPQGKKLADHVFGNLSNENIHELMQRHPHGLGDRWPTILPFIRDHGALNEVINDRLFGSAKTAEELYDSMDNMGSNFLNNLRFAELNDKVIKKIRTAVFHHPGSRLTVATSNENIAALIKRKGGLDAVSAPYTSSADGSERPVFVILFENDRLTGEIVRYVLSERPTLLEKINKDFMDRVPKDHLRAVVFGDKSSELSEPTFRTALKAVLKVDEDYHGKNIFLEVDQVEALIRNPHIISREEFDEDTEETDRNFYLNLYIYRDINRDVPEDFRDQHLTLFMAYLRSLTGESSLGVKIPGRPGIVRP